MLTRQDCRARLSAPVLTASDVTKMATCAIYYLQNSFKLVVVVLQNFPYHALVKHYD